MTTNGVIMYYGDDKHTFESDEELINSLNGE
jgi:hypothetical protein